MVQIQKLLGGEGTISWFEDDPRLFEKFQWSLVHTHRTKNIGDVVQRVGNINVIRTLNKKIQMREKGAIRENHTEYCDVGFSYFFINWKWFFVLALSTVNQRNVV